MAAPAPAASPPREGKASAKKAAAEPKDNFREVIVMHYLEDLSYKAITEATGLTHHTIAMRLHRKSGDSP